MLGFDNFFLYVKSPSHWALQLPRDVFGKTFTLFKALFMHTYIHLKTLFH